MNIIQALDDAKVFGGQFRGATWDAWRTFLAALFALPLTPEQLEVYQRHTGRSAPPTEPAQEAWLVCGRRAGKSRILATIAVFLAGFYDWRRFLGPGELATIMIIARDRRQARVIKRLHYWPVCTRCRCCDKSSRMKQPRASPAKPRRDRNSHGKLPVDARLYHRCGIARRDRVLAPDASGLHEALHQAHHVPERPELKATASHVAEPVIEGTLLECRRNDRKNIYSVTTSIMHCLDA